MELKKQIAVLSGAGHKGLVKFAPKNARNGWVSGVCTLDFCPKHATLYLIGKGVSSVKIDESSVSFELPLEIEDQFGCVLQSSAITMFGGDMTRSVALSRIDKARTKSNVQKDEKENAAAEEKRKTVEDDSKSADERIATSTEKSDQNEEEKSAADGGVVSAPDAMKTAIAAKDVDNRDEASVAAKKQFGSTLSVKYDGNNFYLAVKPQLDELFVCYKAHEQLSKAVPNSKWVQIDAEDGSYVVGLLFDGDEPTYICYGVPASAHTPAPEEIASMCVWLPMDDECGYWVIYQSAKTGDIVK